MRPYSERLEGHRHGGPLFFVLFALLLAGCAGGGGRARGQPEEPALARPLQVYAELGMLAGSEEFPAVGSFSTLAGPADSTYVLFGLSLPNTALRFQREAEGFRGEYAVELTFEQDSVVVRRIERREVVRIGRFADTGRTDESVIFQALVPLPPGRYAVTLRARDGLSTRGFEATDTLDVPAHDSGLGEPVLVYRAAGRSARRTEPDLVLNPRRTVAYGDQPPRLYLEGYDGAQAVQVRVRDEAGQELWAQRVVLTGQDGIGHALVEIPAASLPVGRTWIETSVEGSTAPPARTPLVVTISDQWMVSNFEEALEFLTYIGAPEELDSLREASGPERRELWERFWRRRDPVPATPQNEFRDDFFERIRLATLEFAEAGVPGWRTDRGEVFVVLGPPDQVIERRLGRDAREQTMGQPNALEWIYDRGPGGRIDLLFLDRGGLGRFELTPASRSEFREAAARLRPRPRS